MSAQKPPLPLLVLGWLAAIGVLTACFILGWREVQLTCRRPSPGAPPTCQVRESFAMGLYTRQTTAEQAIGVSFQIRPSDPMRPGGGSTSTVILATPGGEAAVSQGADNIGGAAKGELLRKMQEFLDTPNSLEFRHQARLHSIFGYLGAVGVGGLLFLLPAVLWRRRLSSAKTAEKG
jgi:hypothetical protein